MARRADQGRTAGRGTGVAPGSDPLEGLRRLQDEMQEQRRRRSSRSTHPPSRPAEARRVGSNRPQGRLAPGPVPGTVPPGPGGPPPIVQPGRRKPRRSRGQRLLRLGVIGLALVLVVAGSLYGYVQWRLGQIKSAPCTTCAAVVSGQPYNVLIVGSDSRAGDSASQAQSFGSSSVVTGQRSDTIKILHVDPGSGTARLLSIPRDTFVTLSGLPAGTGLSSQNKINSAFNNGPDPLIRTIEDTFGIPIAHYVTIDFDGVINLVNAVGGINLDFKYPVRDDDDGNNNSGLSITNTGCQTLNGTMALALARSRYYQYYADGYWQSDPTSDLGRITRQNTVIRAVIDKAKGSLNPITLNSFLDAVVHNITKDDALSGTGLISLAQNYHAFSGSDLQSWTLPTVNGVNEYAGDVQVVEQPEALQVITAFLGQAPQAVTTPPLDQYGNAIPVPTTTTAPATTAPASGSGASGSGAAGSAPTTTVPPQVSQPDYDPTPC